jgi:hypothetical protein
MLHFADALQREASDAIARMQEAALAARRSHACAELMRHMIGTARKTRHLPETQAIETIVREWMNAWHLQPSEWPQLRAPMTAFTAAIREYVNKPDDVNDAEVRACWAALDTALAKEGTEIADQMAWRSQCAHGWWEMVLPAPADLPGRTPRPQIPAYEPGNPFWHAGCNERCL